MKKYTNSLIAAVFAFAAASANAAVIDFAHMANTTPGEMGIQPLNIDVFGDGSLYLDVYGYNASGPTHAYLDAFTGGLGVCTTLDADNQCNPANDDNVTDGEYLQFVFSHNVLINDISFNNNHDGGFVGGSSSILVDGTSFVTPDSGRVTATMADPFAGVHMSSFIVAYDNTQFYVQSINVPEPAGLALLGLGLLGFGVARRAKR
jgi:hypothetical protein